MTGVARRKSIALGFLMALAAIAGGELPAMAQSTAAPAAAAKAGPGVVVAETASITALFSNLQKWPEGKTRTIKVDSSVKRLKEVKKGDQVVLRYTEAARDLGAEAIGGMLKASWTQHGEERRDGRQEAEHPRDLG